MTREKVIDVLRRELPYFVSAYGVKKIGLFGSYAKGTPAKGSDIDILVEFEYKKSYSARLYQGIY